MGRLKWKNPPRDRTGQVDKTKEDMKEWSRRPVERIRKDKVKEMEKLTRKKRRLGL